MQCKNRCNVTHFNGAKWVDCGHWKQTRVHFLLESGAASEFTSAICLRRFDRILET